MTVNDTLACPVGHGPGPDAAALFCGECGASLVATPATIPPPPATPAYGYGTPVPAAPAFAAPYAAAPQTSTKAILALVFAFLFPLLGIVFGHLARGEIRRSRGAMTGNGMALAGLIISYLSVGLTVVFWLFLLGLIYSTPS